MKKIFAFILASIMVLSLVPASAFAAITKDEPCPDVHTVANCKYSVLKTQDATCEENGYTIFKCNKCGEQFIGNVIAGGEHVWVSDPDLADEDVTPNCKKPYEVDHDDDDETDDIVVVGELNQICSECGATRLHYVTEAEYHAENGVWVSGVGCEAIYECPVCEEQFNVNGGEVGEHEGWELVEVLSEPVYSAGKKTSGLALFACTNEDCKATKKVEILAECDCSSIVKNQVNFYKLVLAGRVVKTKNAKNPTCDKDGNYALYKCTDCNTVYRWETDNVWKPTTEPELAVNENGSEYVKGGSFKKITDTSTGSSKYASKITTSGGKGAGNSGYGSKFYTIKAPGHQIDDSIPVIDNGCAGLIYTCKLCKEQFTKDGHSWYETLVLLPTCETYGITYKSCTACGKTESKVTDPLGHNIQTFSYPSTCGSYGYTITYCKNAGVQKYKEAGQPDKNVPKCEYTNMTLGIGDDTDDHEQFGYTDPKTGIYYNDVRVGKKLYPIIAITPNTTLAGDHKMSTVTIIGGGNDTNCSTSYVVVEQCADCQFINYRQVAGKGHNLKVVSKVDATCAAPGMIRSECTNDGCTYEDVAIIPQLTTHVTKLTIISYNCAASTTAVYTVVCNNALKVRAQPTTESEVLGSLTNGTVIQPKQIMTVGEYQWYQIEVSAGVLGWVRGDYVTVATSTSQFFYNPADGHYYHGYGVEACACGYITGKTVYIDKVGATTSNVWFDTLEDAKVYHGEGLTLTTNVRPSSCDVDGYAIYKCSKCGISVYVLDEADGHVPTGVVVPGKVPTCTAPGLKEYYTCAKCYVSIIKNDKGEWVKVTANELVLNPHTNPQYLEEVKVYACDEKSYVSYWKCTAPDANGKECGKIFADKECTKPVDKIPEGGIHNWRVLYEGVTLTCNNDGYPSIRYCATCKTLERVQFAEALDEDGKVVVVEFDPAARAENNTAPENCHVSDYDFYLVKKDVEEYEIPLYINYVNGIIDVTAYKVPKISHGEAQVKDKNDNKHDIYKGTEWYGIFDHEAYKSALVCGESYGYTGHQCELCGYEYINGFDSAVEGHVNVYGEVIEATCENYAKYPERRCVVCGQMVGADASIHNMATDEDEFIEVEASCISEGYVFTYCTNEGCTFVDVVSTTPIIPAKEYHKDTDNLTSSKPQDYAHNGDVIWTCNACGEVVKVDTAKDYKLPAGFEIYPSVEYSKYAVGSYVDVVVTLDSLKGVDVWAFNFTVQYTADFVEFVGAKTTSETGFNAIAHKETMIVEDVLDADGDNNTTEKIEIPTGCINVLVDSKAGVEIKGEQELMVLTFKVVSELKAANPYLPAPESIGFMVYDAEAVAPNGKDVKVNALGANATKQFKVTEIFDLNNDGETTIADAYELYALIELGGYNVLGDVNGNGINDAFDLNELYLYIIGAKSAEEVLKGEVEEEERVITYDEYGYVTYDSLYDINDDGVLNAYEIAVMTGKIDPNLNQN